MGLHGLFRTTENASLHNGYNSNSVERKVDERKIPALLWYSIGVNRATRFNLHANASQRNISHQSTILRRASGGKGGEILKKCANLLLGLGQIDIDSPSTFMEVLGLDMVGIAIFIVYSPPFCYLTAVCFAFFQSLTDMLFEAISVLTTVCRVATLPAVTVILSFPLLEHTALSLQIFTFLPITR